MVCTSATLYYKRDAATYLGSREISLTILVGLINYKYKPDYCERTKQHTIREESLFDTEQEALIALFEQFKEKVKNKLDFFGKEANRLGIKQELRLL